MSKIKNVFAREILDSRGNPTIEVDIELEDGTMATAAVPSGASTGKYEALELRDGDEKRYQGRGVLKAVANVNEKISAVVIGMDSDDQDKIDKAMIELDGTENKSNLGANAILGVSLACARSAALSKKIELYNHINNLAEKIGIKKDVLSIPTPMFNVINGGKHSDSGLAIQEYKIIPKGINKFSEQLRAGSEIFHNLKSILSAKELSVGVGDEGGFAPHLGSNREPLELMKEAIEKTGYRFGEEVSIGIDAAASSFYDSETQSYLFQPEQNKISRETLINIYKEWIDKFSVISIEDGLNEDDWEGWKIMNEKMGDKTILIGDDLLVTDVKRLQKAIEEKACNAVLIKVNQIGTLTETLECIKLAKENSMKVIVSHRSGETTDDFIADLAVGVGAEYLKAGSLSRGERIAKYNRLLRIEEKIG